ncbi:conserved hypothetical protein, partial [Ricinus communis]
GGSHGRHHTLSGHRACLHWRWQHRFGSRSCRWRDNRGLFKYGWRLYSIRNFRRHFLIICSSLSLILPFRNMRHNLFFCDSFFCRRLNSRRTAGGCLHFGRIGR